MKTNHVIELRQYRATSFDYDGFNRRAEKRYRRSAICQLVMTVLDSLCTITLIACLLVGTFTLLALV